MAWLGLSWHGVACMARLGLAWLGIIAHGLAWPGLAWHDLAWHDMACLGLVWLDIIEHRAKCIAKDSYPGSWIPHVGYPKSTQTAVRTSLDVHIPCCTHYCFPTCLLSFLGTVSRPSDMSWGFSGGSWEESCALQHAFKLL